MILAIVLFLVLFKKYKDKHVKPWKLLFIAVLIYVAEELITVVDMAEMVTIPRVVFPLLEMGIITIFIYVLLLQKELAK